MHDNQHDLADETLVSLKEGHKLPHPHPPTRQELSNWINYGILPRPRLHDHPELLESIQIAGLTYTSVEAYLRWKQRLNQRRNEALRQRRHAKART